MAKIVLVNPPISLKERYGSFAMAGSNLPPLGLCHLASVVKVKGHKAQIIDAPTQGWYEKEVVAMVEQENPDFVGLTACTVSIFNAASLASSLKKTNPERKIILGGPHLTAVPEETMNKFPQFDIGVIGEGEWTLLELMDEEGSYEELSHIKGIIFRQEGIVTRTSLREFIKHLDTLPLPAWDLLPNLSTHYSQSALRSHRFPSTMLITSRGCFGRCIFCDRGVFGNKVRLFSAEYVMGMIEYLARNYGIKDISFYDDNFVVSSKRLYELCEMIQRNIPELSWSCDARVDLISPASLKFMKEAGCWQISYGIESGSQKILDIEKKNITIEQIKQAVAWTKEVGIRIKGFFMIGHPLETIETLEQTLRFAKELPLDECHATYVTPLPGSELYRLASKYGSLEDNWSKMNMWYPVFVPVGLTKKELERYRQRFFRQFYFRPRIVWSYLKMVRGTLHVKKLFKGFLALIFSLVKRY